MEENPIPMYLFQDDSIGIYELGIDLLRNDFKYSQLDFRDVKSINIKKGFIRNWILLLLIGCGLILTSILLVVFVYQNSVGLSFWTNLLLLWHGNKGGGFIAILFLLAFGIYSITMSLKPRRVMIIETDKKKKFFIIDKFFKHNTLDELIKFLDERVDKLIIDKKLT